MPVSKPVAKTLAVFLESSEELSGLEIMRQAGLRAGTVYSALELLVEGGWLSPRWEERPPGEEDRPRRRLYRLTPAGEDGARLALLERRGR